MSKTRIDQQVRNTLRKQVGAMDGPREFYVTLKIIGNDEWHRFEEGEMADIAQECADAANRRGDWYATLERYGREA